MTRLQRPWRNSCRRRKAWQEEKNDEVREEEKDWQGVAEL
jgi:hypothetical protein